MVNSTLSVFPKVVSLPDTLLRSVICQEVRNIVTLGGPHMGVAAVPHCFDGIMCDIVNTVAKKFVYQDWAQDWIAPAGYFRDVNDYTTYEKDSVFLPALNNEHSATAYSDLRK